MSIKKRLLWQLAPLVEALQALKGIALVIAITVVAEVGDITRFDNPKELMAYLGMVPSEHFSGSRIRPRGITKTGNKLVRVWLYEAAWNYTRQAKVGKYMLNHRPNVPQSIHDMAWKAQLRLHKRYKHLVKQGKKSQVDISAIARELIGFIWAIACEGQMLKT